MKRWGVCRMIAEEDGFVPAINKFSGINYRIIHLGNPQWVVFQAAAQDFTAINADQDCIVLPDLTLDSIWGSLPSNVRNAAIRRLADEAMLDTSGIKTTSSIREVLNLLGRQIDPSFDCERGDVRDLP